MFLREDNFGSPMAYAAGNSKNQIPGPVSSDSNEYISNDMQVGDETGDNFSEDNIENYTTLCLLICVITFWGRNIMLLGVV